MKITNSLFTAFLNCKCKAWKILEEEHREPNAYEEMIAELQEEHKFLAKNTLLNKLKLSSAPSYTKLSMPLLSKRHPLILNTSIEYGQLCVHCDALYRVDDKSELGNTLYEPVLFHLSEKIRMEQKLCLSLAGYAISKVQGIHPTKGKIIFGKNCFITTIQLTKLNKKMLDIIHALMQMLKGENKPTLFLNKHCNVCMFRDKCQEEAIAKDSLSRLRGITEREMARQNNKGIFTVTQYSYTYRPRKRHKNNEIQTRKHHWALNALAIRTDTIYIEKVPELPHAKIHLYLDIEGVPDRNFYYLIGAIVNKGGKQEKHVFWANNESSERNIWLSFVNLINKLDDLVIFHYGNYDIRGLIQLCRRYVGSQSLEDLLKSASYNVLSAIYGHIYFPCHSNELKSVASCLGFKWHDSNSSGVKSIVHRLSWERRGSKASRDWLIRYNKDDCRALHLVTEVIYDLCRHNNISHSNMCKSVVHTDTLKNSNQHELIKNRSFFPELEIINRRSYFDYQRSRIYVRTNHNLRKSMSKHVTRRPTRPIIDKTITLEPPTQCTHCMATCLSLYGRLETIVQDLKFSRKGVKRYNIKYRSFRCLCKRCQRVFVPRDFHEFATRIYGHNLMAWSVFHSIESRQSNTTITEGMRQLFGHIFDRKLPYRLKRKAAAFYAQSYQLLKEKVRSAHVVYADETPTPTKDGQGYVWVFTTLEEVFYIYSNTREGSIVRQILEDFDGVLVSDFYAAYDSLSCRQQKCLIHLIRDLNEDLFKNPFDEELKELTRGLTRLLMPIVGTIDKYGLKKRHLGKFIKPADKFISSTIEQTFVSKIAKGYQQRINKNHDKLFEFLKHDNVAWSNNNAEHAIKRFAMLGRIIGNKSTRNGIQEYLILLSICETLRRRNLSFLRFLLSKSRNLDKFS